MGINWDYDKDVKQREFEIIPVGVHRCRIEEATEEYSEKGNQMITLKLEVAGYASRVFFYLVFMDDHKDITNSNLKSIYDSFQIPEGNLNANAWEEKAGAVKIKHEKYGGEDRHKVSYFIPYAKQKDLPAWPGAEVKTKNPEPDGWS